MCNVIDRQCKSVFSIRDIYPDEEIFTHYGDKVKWFRFHPDGSEMSKDHGRDKSDSDAESDDYSDHSGKEDKRDEEKREDDPKHTDDDSDSDFVVSENSDPDDSNTDSTKVKDDNIAVNPIDCEEVGRNAPEAFVNTVQASSTANDANAEDADDVHPISTVPLPTNPQRRSRGEDY